MLKILNITDPRIEHYKSLRGTPLLHEKGKIFIAEGVKVTEKLLNSKLDVLSIFALPEYYERFGDLIDLKKIHEENCFVATREVIENIVGYRLHEGIMAIGKQPAMLALEELTSPIVILNGIINSENVGSIVRNCAAFGIKSIIYDNETSSPYLRRAVRVSMGGVFSKDIHYTKDLENTIGRLKNDLGYTLIAAEVTENAITLNKFSFPEKWALIFGNEGKGVNARIIKEVDYIIKIPITDEIASLNVAASSAVFLFYAMEYKAL